jgi:uncharacterized protein (DUF983 family)
VTQKPHHPADAREGEGVRERALKPALLRGWRRRCPNCGTGHLLDGFLTVRDTCPDCGEALHHQRADDGPAYLTILITGHVLAPLMLLTYTAFRLEPAILATGFALAAIALSLFLLPRLKGMMVAFQWAKRMHGFGA